MLRFVFAALVVLLDQFFKRWIVITLARGGETIIVPGLLSLIYVENIGAAFSILAGQRWLLAGIALAASVIIVFILLRYTDGFWGSLGLAAVLGGTVGNLIDRVFHGFVIDMFKTLFMNFAIFNIADIFITLGALTFCIHFIISSTRSARIQGESTESTQAGDPDELYEYPGSQGEHDNEDSPDSIVVPPFLARNFEQHPEQSESTYFNSSRHVTPIVLDPEPLQEDEYESVPEQITMYDSELQQTAECKSDEYESDSQQTVYSTPVLDVLSTLESELAAVEDYDIDKLLREYGFEDDKS